MIEKPYKMNILTLSKHFYTSDTFSEHQKVIYYISIFSECYIKGAGWITIENG